MKKKLNIMLLILCTSCFGGNNINSENISHISNEVLSYESITSSFSFASESEFSTSEKDIFEIPKNAKIENDIFSWDKVDGASNGYRVRINSKDTIDTRSTSISINDHIDKLIKGLNTFEVRVNGTENYYISSYSLPVNYLFGVNEEKANEFINKVNEIKEINLDSLELINEAKMIAKSLDQVDFFIDGVNEAYELLKNKEGQYFLFCVNNALSLNNEDLVIEKNKINELYANLLDTSNQYVLEALNIAFDYEVNSQVFENDKNETVLYIYAYGYNIFNNKLTDLKPIVKQNNNELSINGANGIYNTIITDDVTIYYGGNEVKTIIYKNSLNGYVVGITGDNNISFGYNGEETISKYKVYIFDNNDVDLSIENKYFFNDLPLASFETNYNPFMLSKVRNALIEKGYVGIKDIRLVIEAIDSVGNTSKVSLESIESNPRTINLDGGLKLSSPLEVWNVAPSFLENGDLDYKWEMINANSEFSDGLVECLEFRIYDSSLTFVGEETNTLAIINKTSGGFITSNDVISILKANNVYGKIEVKIAIRFIAKDGNGYLSSDFDHFTNSYVYEVDNSLNTYGSISVDSSSGRLIWPWEIFMENNNSEANHVDHIRVYVFDESVESPNEASSLGEFDIYYPQSQFTYKDDIEDYLFNLSLTSGYYKFSAKLIAKEDSNYEDSNYYPITTSYYYEVKTLSEVNIAKNKLTITSSSYVHQNDAKSSNIVDGNTSTGWRAINNEGEYVNTWIVIDLEKNYELSLINIYWEAACALSYDIYLSNEVINSTYEGDFSEFNKIATGGNEFVGGVNPVDNYILNNVQGRYLIINCVAASSAYGNMLYEVEVFASRVID